MFLLEVCVSLLALCCVFAPGVSGKSLPGPAHFFSHGCKLDTKAPVNDDGSVGPITIPMPIRFYKTRHSNLFLNTNGVLSFDAPFSIFTPKLFPLKSYVVIAPYWADVDTTANEGRVYYRSTTNTRYLNKLSNVVRTAFGNKFLAKWAFIATWDQVTFYGGSTHTPRNTFQVVLMANRFETYVIYNYGDISWTTGKASGGDKNGLGGYPAEVGLNDGTLRRRYYAQFGSLTSDIVDIRTESNCGLRGRYLFRVDTMQVLSPEPQLFGNPRPVGPRASLKPKPTSKP